MSAWRLLCDDGAGAAEGLAMDEALMRSYWDETVPAPALRLYTYRSHCALVGRFQDPAAELHLGECSASGTQVNRRPTGGGAIVMGESQLGVALVTSLRDPATPPHSRAIIDTFGSGIVRGLASLGVEAEVRGKNDIAVAGRKIAGLGVYTDSRDAVLFHASILCDLDVAFMLRVLNVPAAKLADKGIESVARRVTTISEQAGRPIGAGEARAAVAGGFAAAFGATLDPSEPGEFERARAARLVAERYGTQAWVSQRTSDSPTGSSVLKTPGGLLRIAVGLAGEAVKEVLVTGDFMAGDRAVAEIEAALRWAPAARARVAEAVETGVRRGGGLDGVARDDLIEAVWQAVVDARARRGASGSCYYPTTHQEAVSWR